MLEPDMDEVEENIMHMLSALDLNDSDTKLGFFYDDTATDLYKLMQRLNESGENSDNMAIICAFELYLDFINVFIDLLRLFGKSKD